jgi:hypothetical protein
MSDAIQQAIAAAKAAQAATATANAAAPANAVAVQGQQGTSVATYAAPAPKLNMESVSSGSMTVDAWIKPKEFGLLIGDSSALFENAICSIDMTDGKGFIVKKGIKAGNPAQYFYTTDGVTCTTGGSWEAAVMKAKGIDPKAYEYRCVDLPFVLLEDVVVKGVVVSKAGTKLGYTTSTTNWKAWEEFYKVCSDAGVMDEPVKVKLGHLPRTNTAGNKWGILTLELMDTMANAEAGE